MNLKNFRFVKLRFKIHYFLLQIKFDLCLTVQLGSVIIDLKR